jgi:hypothetical protein
VDGESPGFEILLLGEEEKNDRVVVEADVRT